MISHIYNNNGSGQDSQEYWKFFDYSTSGGNHIEEWYQGLSLEGQILFDALLKNNHKTGLFKDWIGFRGFLKGKPQAHKIWELGFSSDKRQNRILGIFSELGRRQAIFLIGCYHKDKRYTPANALDTACKRASDLQKDLKEGRASLNERTIKFDL